MENFSPAFTVWPLTAAHVQAAVSFAVRHDLCIQVAGTGHDFMNRHSCHQGVFIRTSLMKEVEWDLQDVKSFGWAEGNAKLGPGLVFSELQSIAAEQNRFFASGWANTVGIVGWSLGGGHGPFGPSKGLGVDNILEVELVTADGSLVTANALGTTITSPDGLNTTEQESSDLFWSLRGGGGSAFGVVTAITLRAHTTPATGFTMTQKQWKLDMCDPEENIPEKLNNFLSWSLGLSPEFSQLSYWQSYAVEDNDDWVSAVLGPYGIETCEQYKAAYVTLPTSGAGQCDAELVKDDPACDPLCQANPSWLSTICPVSCGETCPSHVTLFMQQAYMGEATSAEYNTSWALLESILPGSDALLQEHYTQWYDRLQIQAIEPITPLDPSFSPESAGLLASVVVGRDKVADGSLSALMLSSFEACNSSNAVDGNFGCGNHQLYQAITGNNGSASLFSDDDVSVGTGMRHGMIHYLIPQHLSLATVDSQLYPLGENSYFSESAYFHTGTSWKQRYWGDKYERLEATKLAYDPRGVFWCRHCVGSDLPFIPSFVAPSPTPSPSVALSVSSSVAPSSSASGATNVSSSSSASPELEDLENGSGRPVPMHACGSLVVLLLSFALLWGTEGVSS
jgi:hypothetical protein